ncbi:aminopeptidase PepB [Candidatus Providencia siddallii]
MSIVISLEPADEYLKKKSLLSFGINNIKIHLKNENELHKLQIAGRKIDDYGIYNVALIGKYWNLENCWAFWQGYRSPKNIKTIKWPQLLESEYIELNNRVRIIDWVRDIINLSSNELGPEKLSEKTINLLNTITLQKIKCNIIKGKDLLKKKYIGIYAVGCASNRDPIFLTLDYNPHNSVDAPVFACLVGKAITFDSGGYSLKSSSSMKSMKADMGGAAILVGALALAITRGFKERVKIFLCIADNMISGNAYKLGDIIHYRNGKSVEITNTDAEGRLILADGLIDASRENPSIIIDAATLTGAATVAVGNDYHAIFCFNDNLIKDFIKSSNQEYELFWRLPLDSFHRKQLQSNFADLNNVSVQNTAGASTAAAFLSYFVEKYQENWIHIDCSASYCESQSNLWSVGATGIGVRTIANFLINKAK